MERRIAVRMESELSALREAPLDRLCPFVILATTVAGLEEIAAAQIRKRFPAARELRTQRGKVFFAVKATLSELLSLRCAENLHFVLGTLSCGRIKAELSDFCQRLKRLPFAVCLPYLCDTARRQRLHVSASRTGKHSFSRFDLAEQAQNALCETKWFEKGEESRHDLHLRIDLMETEATVSVKLTAPAFRYRSTGKAFMPGATAPSVANAMVYLSAPDAKDVFLDPFCGSGTVAVEREQYPHRKLFASDLSEEAVEATRQNVRAETVVRWGDARALSFGDACLDAIVTNLPWDVQIRSEDLFALYTDFLREVRRTLRPDGRCVVLTDKKEILEEACAKNGFGSECITQLSYHGLHPWIFRLYRL